MKTIKLEGRALEVAREMARDTDETMKTLAELSRQYNDLSDALALRNRDRSVKLFEAVGVKASDVANLDLTYLVEHGAGYLQLKGTDDEKPPLLN